MSTQNERKLGKLVSVHETSPAHMQRSVVVAGLAFVFFLVMMFAFYTRQWFVYFLLATAFLVVNLFTLAGIWLQKRNRVRVFTNGLIYKKGTVFWADVARLRIDPRTGLTLETANRQSIRIPPVIEGLSQIAAHINSELRAG